MLYKTGSTKSLNFPGASGGLRIGAYRTIPYHLAVKEFVFSGWLDFSTIVFYFSSVQRRCVLPPTMTSTLLLVKCLVVLLVIKLEPGVSTGSESYFSGNTGWIL